MLSANHMSKRGPIDVAQVELYLQPLCLQSWFPALGPSNQSSWAKEKNCMFNHTAFLKLCFETQLVIMLIACKKTGTTLATQVTSSRPSSRKTKLIRLPAAFLNCRIAMAAIIGCGIATSFGLQLIKHIWFPASSQGERTFFSIYTLVHIDCTRYVFFLWFKWAKYDYFLLAVTKAHWW